MFSCLFSSDSSKSKYSSKNQYYQYVSKRLKKQEISLLGLIYRDLASRNSKQLLTFDNFILFFDLKGLWGAKLFDQFDEDRQQLVTFEQFLYGISRTAKAPMQEKIRLLYTFFEQNIQEGIDFKNFTKMLYNYSKQQLKEILISDGIGNELVQKNQSTHHQKVTKNSKSSYTLQINCKQTQKSNTSFDKCFQDLIKNHEEGTFYEINQNQINYKIKYSNMSTLIREFATEIYLNNGIDIHKNKHGRLQYEQFSAWIKYHKKLFKSYYSEFNTQIWCYNDDEPNYLDLKADLQFQGKISCEKNTKKVYAILIEGLILFFESKKTKNKPIKAICLKGLDINIISELQIEISYCQSCYKNTVMHFQDTKIARQWLQEICKYQRDSLWKNYTICQIVGSGKFSVVYRCIQKQTNKQYALKVIGSGSQKLPPSIKKLIKNQSQIMKVLNHPQLIKYKQTIPAQNSQYIITQYVYGQELFEYVKKRKHLNEFESAFIMGNIIKAVMFLHDMDIIHRDLKPENIMVIFKYKKKNQIFECTSPHIRKGQRIQDIKIIDFGLSNHISKINQKTQVVGTPNYIAPQILLGNRPSFKSDIFSIGSILYFLLSGCLPFNQNNLQSTLKRTVRGDYDVETGQWENISWQAKDLLSKLLESQPEQRISLSQAMDHPWFNKAYSKSTQSDAAKSDIQTFNENLETNDGLDICVKKQRQSDNMYIEQQQQEVNRRSC